MPFWEKLAPRERVLVSVALGMALIYLLYSYVIMPQWQKYQELKIEYTAVNTEWERLQGIENVLAAEVKNKEQLEKELKNIRAEFDFNLEDGAGFTKILASAKEKNIRLLEFKPGSVVDKSYYFEFPVEIKVQGYYPQVLEYVESLENFPDLAEIRNLTIVTAQGDARGNVEAAFTLAIYSAKNPTGSLLIQNYEKIPAGKYNPFRPMYIPPVATTPANGTTGIGETVTGDTYNNDANDEPLVK